MKKFIIIFIILLMVGSVVFYLGWIQILIPPNSYAVLHTKTGGFEEKVIPSGTFCWRWERLIPNNMTVNIYNLSPYTYEIKNIQIPLPSADTYKSVIFNNVDFTYGADLIIKFTLQPDALPALASKEGLKTDNLGKFLSDNAVYLEKLLIEYGMEHPENVLNENFKEEFQKIIAGKGYYYIVLVDVKIHFTKIPDLTLYNNAREKYLEILEITHKRDIESITQLGASPLVLKEYGEILSQYPILIKYLLLKEITSQNADSVIPYLMEDEPMPEKQE